MTHENIPVTTPTNNECRIATKVRQTTPSSEWIFFIHGWGGTKECFDAAFERPRLRGFNMCSLDLIGFGESDKPSEFSYDLADQAHAITQLIRTLGAKAVRLVGHSMGGGIGLLCAQEAPDVQRFISVEGILASTDSRTMREYAKQNYGYFEAVSFPDLKRELQTSDRADYKAWGEWMASSETLSAYRSAVSATKWADNGELLSRFKQLFRPTYVYGQNSERVPYILPKLVGVETRAIADSQHFPMIDNQEQFYRTIEKLVEPS